MPCCAAAHCCNREIGVRLFRFPKDATRREIWRAFCERGEWQPTKNHKLCEVHFSEDQFEPGTLTKKGNRKLKTGAIPTQCATPSNVDSGQVVKQVRRIKQQNKAATKGVRKVKTETKVISNEISSPPSVQDKRSVFLLMVPNGPDNKKMGVVIKGPEDLAKVKQMYGPLPPIQHIKMKRERINQVCNGKLNLSELTSDMMLKSLQSSRYVKEKTTSPVLPKCDNNSSNGLYDRKYRLLMAQNNNLRRKLAKTNLRLYVQSRNLRQFLNVDQMNMLRDYNRPIHWSNETIHNCAQIMFACGRRGYKCLRLMGFPLPSLRTLNSAMEKKSDVSAELIECNVEITVDNDDTITCENI